MFFFLSTLKYKTDKHRSAGKYDTVSRKIASDRIKYGVSPEEGSTTSDEWITPYGAGRKGFPVEQVGEVPGAYPGMTIKQTIEDSGATPVKRDDRHIINKNNMDPAKNDNNGRHYATTPDKQNISGKYIAPGTRTDGVLNPTDQTEDDATEMGTTLNPVTFPPVDLRLHPVNPEQQKFFYNETNNDHKTEGKGVSPQYDFSPYYSDEDELADKNTMDYVKGIGYVYIYNNVSYVNHEFNNKATLKTILLYNPFYDDEDYKFGLGQEPFVEHFCTINKCRTTDDKSQLVTADMVIFFAHGLDYTKSDTLPKRGHPEQIFVFWNHESPFYRTRNKLRRFRTVFNLTVSYRLDSSIPLPLYQTRARLKRNPKALVTEYHLKDKTKLAVWMISACHKIGSLRYPYVKELRHYISVDTYGACGNLTCPRSQTNKCLNQMEQTYKFYLAFENSMCKDYITEKPFRTLKDGNWVPIVMGGGDYTRHLPPHSFIDVRDFQSPRHLAEYLKFLDRNDKEYLKYFDWKLDWLIWRVHTKVALCRLCEILHGIGRERVRSDLNIHDWWETGGECVAPANLAKYVHLVRHS